MAITKENVEEVPLVCFSLHFIPLRIHPSDCLCSGELSSLYTTGAKHFSQYVKDIFNPQGDGNCGFRCIAHVRGYADNMEFMQVWEEMAREIMTWNVGCEKWLDKMLHGQILANTYNRPIVFLSQADSNCFLPLRLGPKDSRGIEPIYLLYVDGNHWVLVEVGAKDGVKPLPPVIKATKFSTVPKGTSQLLV
ncbi:hypothetical protein PSTT_05958 [Puccinia striiformis]|uniref:OTU domain-containing protein n=1 Tax=Puccinia striiformis TaxID=27350 RepID=A0A2S4VM22_9BASI|nr:hypothetical protein PSTT_05958 [Puccinia striiformis]